MNVTRLAILALVLLGAPSSAAGQTSTDPADPELNFEHLWRALDRNYAQFQAKGVDWDALYRVYRPQVTAETSDEELFDTLMSMLGHLNDAHVCLDPGGRRTCAGLSDRLTRGGFSRELVRSWYLEGAAATALEGRLTYGRLAGDIGYLHILDFKFGSAEAEEAIDTVLGELAGVSGMIVDVRDNTGGRGESANLVADRFADRRRHFMTSRVRYGPRHDDFDRPRYWHVRPRGPLQFTGPTILLVNRFTESAADYFALALRVLPHVTLVGEGTGGAFSAQYPDKLPNGWTFWVAWKVDRDPDGVCWDGIGVPPDLFARNLAADIEGGRDRVLELAIRLLEVGELRAQDQPSSLREVRPLLMEEYARLAEEQGLEEAAALLERVDGPAAAEYAYSCDELVLLARRYLQRGELDVLVPLLEFGLREFGQFASLYGMLAQAYLGLDDREAALDALSRGQGVEPMFPWEAPMLEGLRKALEGE